MPIPKPQSNFSMLPHYFVEEMMPKISSLSEMKVLLYVLRHTWGFQDESKTITQDEFMNGRKHRDGTRMDKGCQMSRNAIKSGIEKAVEHGYLELVVNDSDKARIKHTYTLVVESDSDGQELTVGGQKLTVDGQKLTIGVSKVDHRTEKETIDRNLETNLTSEKSDVSDKPKVNELIHAWESTLLTKPIESVNPYNNRHYRKVAQQMIDSGYTPLDVKRYVQSLLAERFWNDKPIKFTRVAEGLPSWLNANPVKSDKQPDLSWHNQLDFNNL